MAPFFLCLGGDAIDPDNNGVMGGLLRGTRATTDPSRVARALTAADDASTVTDGVNTYPLLIGIAAEN